MFVYAGNVKIMRFAYAIEYDCINATELKNNLESKKINGLFVIRR